MTDDKQVLITGASSGIGRALARHFAEDGYRLVLVARNRESLAALAEECAGRYGKRPDFIECDLSRPGTVPALLGELGARGIPIHALVNNAGFGLHGPFCETDLTREMELVQLQIGSLLELTKRLLPAMLAKGEGKILNVASVYSYSPVPLQSVYAACKAFMLSFSASLADEVKDRGITVTVLCPGVTRTEFRRRAGMREKKAASGMSAEAVARAGYRALMAGKRVVIPGFVNRLFVLVVRHLPGGWLTGLMRVINGLRGVNHRPTAVSSH